MLGINKTYSPNDGWMVIIMVESQTITLNTSMKYAQFLPASFFLAGGGWNFGGHETCYTHIRNMQWYSFKLFQCNMKSPWPDLESQNQKLRLVEVEIKHGSTGNISLYTPKDMCCLWILTKHAPPGSWICLCCPISKSRPRWHKTTVRCKQPY